MKILRSAILVAGIAASLATSVMPASAAGAGAFTGTATIDCFGCGTSPGTADLLVYGATDVPSPHVINGGAVHATYTAVEDNDPTTCVISGTATGSTTGAVAVSFNWTRVGAAAVILTNGDIDGAGAALFVVTDPEPPSIPCRSAVTATVVGALAGA